MVDAEHARRTARGAAGALGFAPYEREMVALAAMELATNLVRYAVQGVLVISEVSDDRGHGLQVESRDAGPGIADVEHALTDGASTGGGLGSGLPAVRRLMDTFTLTTSPDQTVIVACKWLPAR